MVNTVGSISLCYLKSSLYPLVIKIFTLKNGLTLPKLIFLLILIVFLSLAVKVSAITLVQQTTHQPPTVDVWAVIQELGDNLSGTADKFTFRVSTLSPNLNQFDFTVQNIRLYDKDTNTYISPCAPAGSSSDTLAGLTFNKTGVPDGYEDVAIDFSCRDYTFISGHKYLILISNANNVPGSGGKRILFATTYYGTSGQDNFIGGGFRYALDNGFCNAGTYTWNSQTTSSGCNVWSTPKDDLYFTLTNNSPPPKTPVIFIPGIGGSELKASQEIIWSAQDGHGGTYSHGYFNGEKIWVNQDEASKLGDDDYFDVLRLKADGVTSEANLSLTGNLTSFGYGDIDLFFIGMGYEKGKNFFVFNYDWRKDVRSNKDNLDSLIEQAKTASGQTKVNLVVHSMGGLIARYYISDSNKALKVNKLIELGVPHLGGADGLKVVMYGKPVGRQIIGDFYLGVPASEVKDVFQNLPSIFQLLPSKSFYNFYGITASDSPFRDDRDIDNNKVTGLLNYDQTKNLLSNLNHNMTVFGLSEELHNFIDPILNQTNGVKFYNIVGSSQPTLGQIHETWWVTWPINLIPKTDEVFINGDGTVPLYSASLKSPTQDFSGGATLYYVEQKHSDLVSSNGAAMQTVKAILNEDSLPVEVKNEKIDLEGEQLSLDDGELELFDDEGKHTGIKDDGELETNIPETFYSTSGKTKHAFVKKKAKKVKVKVTRKNISSSDPKTTNLKIRTYKQDKISKTTLYRNVPIIQTSKAEFSLDPAVDISPSLIFYADSTKTDSSTITSTSEVSGDSALDQTPPTTKIDISGTKNSSGIYTGPVTITLTGSDSNSGILKIEYSLDNGQTVQTYTGLFTISAAGKTIVQFRSIDKVGNEEITQTIVIEISSPASTSSSSSTSGTSSSSGTTDVNNTATSVIARSEATKQSLDSLSSSSSEILGITFQNPSHISDQINVSHILDKQADDSNITNRITDPSPKQILSGLLIVSGGIAFLASLGLTVTFLKPIPK